MIHYEHDRSGTGDYIFFQKTLNLNFHIHLHRSFEYLSVERGSLTLLVGDRRFVLDKNDRALILPGQVHGYECRGEGICFARICIFAVDWMPDFAGRCREELQRSPVLSGGEFLPPSVLSLEKAASDRYLLKAKLYEIASMYMQGEVWENAPLLSDSFTDDFLHYLEAHYTEPVTLKEAAAALGYNYHYISGMVNRCFGSGFPKLLNEYRIARACELLRGGQETITEICHSCGYDSMRSFNRNFRLITGKTPSEYRGGK